MRKFFGAVCYLCVLVLAAQASVRYVRDNNPSPVSPYTTWGTAATNIQDAVDVSIHGDIVMVTNGVYNAGGRIAPGDTLLKTRLIVTNNIVVASVNGPEVTQIVGASHPGSLYDGLGDTAVRCVYLGTNAVLSGFTVTNGFTRYSTTYANHCYGGGIYCTTTNSVVTNCIVVGNAASLRGGGTYQGKIYNTLIASNRVIEATSCGGGCYGSSLYSCLVRDNIAKSDGGGACQGTIVDSTILTSKAFYGGGVSEANIYHSQIISNQATTGGGGIDGGKVYDSHILWNFSNSGGGIYGATVVSNCVVSGNVASESGGGFLFGTVVYDTLISSNRAGDTINGSGGNGGGVCGSVRLVNCTVEFNTAIGFGGGVLGGTLSNCLLRANRARSIMYDDGLGGGAYSVDSAYYCTFLDNESTGHGGGAYAGTFYSCVFSGNKARQGGGTYFSNLYSCTVMGNKAGKDSGGVSSGTIKNSIVYGNEAPTYTNYSNGTFSYSCTWPLPSGAGNVNTNPVVSGYRNPHLLSGSPLIGKGYSSDSWMAKGKDIDGEPRTANGKTDLGADQVHTNAVDGLLKVEILRLQASDVRDGETRLFCLVNTPQTFLAECTGKVGGLVWDFGSGTTPKTNINPVVYTFTATGDYPVLVVATNGTSIATNTIVMHVRNPATFYVSPNGSHTGLFDSWANAATNLQDALDLAALLPGSTVLATNGTYSMGGRPAPWQSITNRVFVPKNCALRSVNGPEVTCIVGSPEAGSANGGLGLGAVRGAYLSVGASIEGFTMRDGYTRYGASQEADYYGGGILCASNNWVISCIVSNNFADMRGGGVYQGTLTNCWVTFNSVNGIGAGAYGVTADRCDFLYNRGFTGGGAANSTLRQCNINYNVAEEHGGGTYQGQITGCVIEGNRVKTWGGGAARAVLLSNCVIRANRAIGKSSTTGCGGGVYSGTAYSCSILDNEANYEGGGGDASVFYSCVFSGNRANYRGGGTSSGVIHACTIMGNTAVVEAGGAYAGGIYNSIIYDNTAPSYPNYLEGSLSYSCSSPLPPGTGNMNVNPCVTGSRAPHLLPGSPLIGLGQISSWMTTGKDIDGEPRVAAGKTDIGADQFYGSGLTGTLSVIILTSTNTANAGWAHDFQVEATGKVKGMIWDFGDGSALVTNINHVTHAFAMPGIYTVSVRVTNTTHEATATLLMQIVTPMTFYVSPSGGHIYPFNSWANAATNLQDGVDAALLPDSEVLVDNGVYSFGGKPAPGRTLSNRVCILQKIHLRSVNGPHVTHIVGAPHPGSSYGGLGDRAVRGVFLADGATLSGFTVTNGFTCQEAPVYYDAFDYSGGGIFCAGPQAIISNCVIVANMANVNGGGIFQGIIYDSLLISNIVRYTSGYSKAGGGGACRVTAFNTVFERNQGFNGSSHGAGANASVLTNCTLIANVTPGNGGGAFNTSLYKCVLRANNASGTSITTGSGGGVYQENTTYTAYACTFIDNVANYQGGGAYNGSYYSCVVSGNQSQTGGGIDGSPFCRSCTIMGNKANQAAGGVSGGDIKNCIIYGNTAPINPNYVSGIMTYTCTSPLPSGAGNTNVNPCVGGSRDPHLLPVSPLIGIGQTGDAWMTTGTDIDGDPRIAGQRTDIGADQFYGNALSGPLSVTIATSTNAANMGWQHDFRAETIGTASGLIWDFGDGSATVENSNPLTHAYALPGTYTVSVRVTNATHEATATLSMQIFEAVYVYVSPSGSHVAPYQSWATAATNLQSGIDAAVLPKSVVLVGDGTYSLGGKRAPGCELTNRVCVLNKIHLRSVNGPLVTKIVGVSHPDLSYGGLGLTAVRGVYLMDEATISGFTVTNGFTHSGTSLADDYYGGGIFCAGPNALISNCVVIANMAAVRGGGIYQGLVYNSQVMTNTLRYTGWSITDAGGGGAYCVKAYNTLFERNIGYNQYSHGAGTYNCTLSNCTLMKNATSGYGGGIYQGSVYDSQVIANQAMGSESRGGGIYYATIISNCIVSGNTAVQYGGGIYQGIVYDTIIASNQVTSTSLIYGYGGGFYGGATTYSLINCIVEKNSATFRGGGVYNAMLSRCMVRANRTPGTSSTTGIGGGVYQDMPSYTAYTCTFQDNEANYQGGGAYKGTFYSCVFTGNRSSDGGGAYYSTLNSCTVAGNTGANGGGVGASTLNNCIVWGNTVAAQTSSNHNGSTFRYSCTTPMPLGAYNSGGNIDSNPLFVNATTGNFRLQWNSSCVNRGKNSYVNGVSDIDGNPRIYNNYRVDMGAYEFNQETTHPSVLVPVPFAWLDQYYPELTTETAYNTKALSEGMNNCKVWESYVAGLVPTNAESLFLITSIWREANITMLTWNPDLQSDRTYIIWGKTNLTDTAWHSPTNSGSSFFRVEAIMPQ